MPDKTNPRPSKGGRPATVVIAPDVVAEMTSLSRRALQDLTASGDFPAPVRLSERRIGWLAREVDAWIEARPRTTFTPRKPADAQS